MSRPSFLRRPLARSFSNMALWIIAANLLAFAATYVWPPVSWWLALSPVTLLSGWFWEPLTYMFAHTGLNQLFFDMLGLLVFGTAVERELGSREFVLYYFVNGALVGLFSLAVWLATGATGAFLIGSSGVLFALLLAFATINPDAVISLLGVVPVKAPLLVLLYAGLEIFSEVSSFGFSPAHLTLLSGFAFGWLYFVIRFEVNPLRRLFPR